MAATTNAAPPDTKAGEAQAFQHLLDTVATRRDEFDRARYVPRDVIALMKQARLFRATTPARFGGDAGPPHLFLEKVERIAQIDGSTAWVAAFGSANSYLAALPVETQARIYATGPDQVFAGGLYPLHQAHRAEGGYRVSGQWRYASGCMGADWLGVGIAIDGGDGKAQLAHMAVCPADEVEIIQNWDVVGMRATGSFDTTVTNKFYADPWICARGAQAQIDEALYRYPPLAYQAQVHTAVNLGLARAALDLAVSMAGAAKIMPGAPTLANRAYYRSGLAHAEAMFRAARLFYYDTAQQAWNTIMAGDPISLEQHNLLRLSATHAAHTCLEVIQLIWRICGMGVVENTNRMPQIMRDALVVTQHAAVADTTLEAAGAILAGLPAPSGFPG